MTRAADLRYHGQSFELTVPLPAGELVAQDLVVVEEAFGREHERTYGHRAGEDEPVEIVSLRLVARGLADGERMPMKLDGAARGGAGQSAPRSRRAYYGREQGWLDTPVVAREQIGSVAQPGPLIIEEYDATTVVPPDAAIWRDTAGNLRLVLG